LLKRADLPTVPVKPNRFAIIMLGGVLALGAGIGLAALVDALDSTIRSVHDLQAGLALKPVGTIPYVRTVHDRRIAWTRRATATGAAIACLVLVVVLI
jgi:capsular polysaccharide biosynthesis protein